MRRSDVYKRQDKNGVAHIRNVLLDLKNSGKTILLASHHQEDIDVLCDTVCEMDGGVLRLSLIHISLSLIIRIMWLIREIFLLSTWNRSCRRSITAI